MAALVGVVGATGMLIAARKTIDSVERVPGVAEHLSAGNGIGRELLAGRFRQQGRRRSDGARRQRDRYRGCRVGAAQRHDHDPAARQVHRRGVAVVDPARPVGRRAGPRQQAADQLGVQRRSRACWCRRCSRATSRIPIHHYVEIDFSGFKSLVDALGGVQICVDYATRDVSTGLDITEPGCHVLLGEQALAYARSRHYEELREDGEWHEDPASDLGRTKRQQQFVNLALQTALDRIKVDPFSAGRLITAIGSSLRVDDELDPISAAAVAAHPQSTVASPRTRCRCSARPSVATRCCCSATVPRTCWPTSEARVPRRRECQTRSD